MANRKFIEIQKIDSPETFLYYESVKIYVDEYPELEGKSEDEIIQYVKENLSNMKSNSPYYDTLQEAVDDADFDYEKCNHLGTEIQVDLFEEDDDYEEGEEEGDDGEYYEDEEEDD